MKVITVGQRKGGNGKTTSALNLAHAFAMSGKRVLLLDLDDQKNSTSAIETVRPAEKTVEDVLFDPAISMEEAAVETTWPGVWLLPASRNLSGVIKALDSDVGSHLILREKLSDLAGFDFCLIDTSPSLNILVLNALCASNYLFIPLSSKYFSLQGLGQTLEAFAKVQKRFNPFLSVLGVAFVIHDQRSALARDVMEKAKEEYPQLTCKSYVGQNIKVEEAQVKKLSILAYAPADRGAMQYRALAAELLVRMGF